MPWIESHVPLDRHPKLLRLRGELGWSQNETVGFLHRFWWMVLEYSPEGRVSTLSPEVMGQLLSMETAEVKRALAAMEAVGFLDRPSPDIVIVHDWLDYAGRYLKTSRFRRKPEQMLAAEALHRRGADSPSSVDTYPHRSATPDDGPSVDCRSTVGRRSVDCSSAVGSTNQTNHSNPTTASPTGRRMSAARAALTLRR